MPRYLLLLLLLPVMAAAPASAEGTVAFFGLYLNDTSGQTTLRSSLQPRMDEAADLARKTQAEATIAQRFRQEGFVLLDLAPVARDLDRVKNPANCYGCDLRMATTLGADFVLVGEITKVSDALLSISLQLRDAGTGAILKGASVDIRGNTDDTWRRGVRYILRNRFFREAKK